MTFLWCADSASAADTCNISDAAVTLGGRNAAQWEAYIKDNAGGSSLGTIICNLSLANGASYTFDQMIINAYKQATGKTLSATELKKVTGLEFTLQASGGVDSSSDGNKTWGLTRVGTLATCSAYGRDSKTQVISVSVPSGRSSIKHTVSLSSCRVSGKAKVTKVYF
jgi:hypothetical protein